MAAQQEDLRLMQQADVTVATNGCILQATNSAKARVSGILPGSTPSSPAPDAGIRLWPAIATASRWRGRCDSSPKCRPSMAELPGRGWETALSAAPCAYRDHAQVLAQQIAAQDANHARSNYGTFAGTARLRSSPRTMVPYGHTPGGRASMRPAGL
jgi:hypothetical protein